MSERDELRARIAVTLFRSCDQKCYEDWPFDEEASAVLAELERTHVLVERGRWVRVLNLARAAFDDWNGPPKEDIDAIKAWDLDDRLAAGDLARDAQAGNKEREEA